jgi:hypothetical protein
MKKLIYLIVLMLILGLIVSGCDLLPVVPTAEKDETSMLTKAKPGTDFNGPHYNLNIIGKKSDWSGGGSYDNPDRHTIFVPENTDEFELDGTPCTAPEPVPTGGWKVGPGITIWMTQGDEFAVLDGTAFDDCKCEFQLGPANKYKVYVAAKAKPNGETDITGWAWVYDETSGWYYLNLGNVNVSHNKKPVWKDATGLFEVDGQWIFDFLSTMPEDAAYFWQYLNQGNKLVQVRFYPVD